MGTPLLIIDFGEKTFYIHFMTMKLFLKNISLTLLCIFFSKELYPQKSTISSGPYIFLKEDRFTVKWVEDGKMEKYYELDSDFIERKFGFTLDPESIKRKMADTPDFYQNYHDVPNLLVISDVHGQYDLMVELLKSQGIIDEYLNWSYGKGHLVINGDILGRGDKVTEALWLAYQLEDQAQNAGGRLHFLLGNHELMVLENDLRFLNQKYNKSARIKKKSVRDLHNQYSVLGNWLRKRPAIVTIDGLLITHAGISPEFVSRKLTVFDVNKIFYENILSTTRSKTNRRRDIEFLTGSNGPLWYRGYFEQNNIGMRDMDSILEYFGANRIIIGHTSVRSITLLLGGKIIAVDSNIKEGQNGEVLIIQDSIFYRGLKDGSRFRFPPMN
jgi:hypothetical protein